MHDTFLRNIRYAIRTLSRSPGFTLTVVLTLALAIGANSAVFSALDAVLLQPLPFPDADRLVSLGQVQGSTTLGNVAPVRLEDWYERNSTFEAMTGYTTENVSETSGERPEHVLRAGVAPRFNEVWRITPALGRSLTAADHQPGAPPVVLISHDFWQSRYGADPNVLNRIVRIDEESSAIVGVMPPSFKFPARGVGIWAPTVNHQWVLNRHYAWYRGYGRLKPGVSLDQARADLTLVQAQLAAQFPDPDRDIGAQVEPFAETTVGGVRNSLWLLFGAVSVLLLIACTNIAALLLSRAAQRRQEIAVRVALGASQWSVAGQMLTEVFILALAGAMLGLAIVAGASEAFGLLAPNFPRVEEIALDGRILLYTLASVVTVTVLCCLFPAIRAARGALRGNMAEAGRSNVSSRHSLQWLFVGVQVALSVTLLAGAGLLIRSFQELWRVDPGFEPERILTFRVSGSFAERDTLIQVIERMIEGLAALPGVDGAATSSPVPGVLNDHSGFQFGAVEFDPVEPRSDGDTPLIAEYRIISPSYFDTMQIPLLSGESCRKQPVGTDSNVMVNRAFATRYLSGSSASGLNLKFFNSDTVVRITGVVGDAREFSLDRAPVPTVYSCSIAVAYPPLAFLVRTRGEPTAIADSVRSKINELEPLRSIYDVVPLEQRMGDEFAQNRLRTVLLAMFAGTALALTCLGVYGTLSYIVSLRRREVGLRVALGALSRNIVTQFLFKAMRVVGIACAIGLALSFAFTRALSGMLFGVSPTDPVTLTGVLVIVISVAALAALLPALRASRIDPMQALREE